MKGFFMTLPIVLCLERFSAEGALIWHARIGHEISFQRPTRAVRFLRAVRRALSELCEPDEWCVESSLDLEVPALLADDT
jgi:hypothetical protein